MKIMGIDYGSSRIGVAVAEMGLRLAFARPYVRGQGSIEKDSANVGAIAKEEGISFVVVGLPLLESGEEGEQAGIARRFGAGLAEQGLSVAFWDERFTTAAARMNLEDAPRKKQEELVDSEAARIMLVDFLSKGDE